MSEILYYKEIDSDRFIKCELRHKLIDKDGKITYIVSIRDNDYIIENSRSALLDKPKENFYTLNEVRKYKIKQLV